MSFGPKLDAVAVVPAGGEIAATLHFQPNDADFKQDATIYVEELSGIRKLKIRVQSPSYEPTS